MLMRRVFYGLVLLFLVLPVVLYGVYVRDNPSAALSSSVGLTFGAINDIGMMMFIGFAGLYAYMKYSGLSGVGLCAIVTPVTMLLYVLWFHLWSKAFKNNFADVVANQPALNTHLAYYSAGTALISMGALYGKIGFIEAIFFSAVEVILYSLNEVICLQSLHCTDAGGSMVIHALGASFGIGMCLLYKPKGIQNHVNNGGDQNSNYIGIIGSMFLWIFWPSFNSALVSQMRKDLAIINTVCSLCASVLTGSAISIYLHKKYNVEDLINSTLAGGVVVGAACDVILNPGAALFVGMLGGAVSAVGFSVLSPRLKKIGLEDTAGIFNLHFLPGVLGGFYSAIIIAFYNYNGGYPKQGFAQFKSDFSKQAGLQAACTAISMGIGLLGGLLTGLGMRLILLPKYQKYVNEQCQIGNEYQVEEAYFFYNDFPEWIYQHFKPVQPALLVSQNDSRNNLDAKS